MRPFKGPRERDETRLRTGDSYTNSLYKCFKLWACTWSDLAEYICHSRWCALFEQWRSADSCYLSASANTWMVRKRLKSIMSPVLKIKSTVCTVMYTDLPLSPTRVVVMRSWAGHARAHTHPAVDASPLYLIQTTQLRADNCTLSHNHSVWRVRR